jgi:hypothetical protein
MYILPLSFTVMGNTQTTQIAFSVVLTSNLDT